MGTPGRFINQDAEFECPAGSTTNCSLSELNCLYWTSEKNSPTNVQAVTKSFPPLTSLVEDVNEDPQVSHVERLKAPESQSSSNDELVAVNPLGNVHVSMLLMDDFLQLAKDNTEKDLEICGILGAILCHAKYEEEFFAIQQEHSLFPVGWIHTHPSQSCFMPSIELHTQYSYQVMVPEAFAIVMAPTDKSRCYGIFRLTDGGMHILRDCQEKSFHPHKESSEEHPIYQLCSNVYTNSRLRFEIFDLR